MASLRCRRDPCGVICLILTYFSVFYADYVVIQYVLIPTYSGRSVLCLFMSFKALKNPNMAPASLRCLHSFDSSDCILTLVLLLNRHEACFSDRNVYFDKCRLMFVNVSCSGDARQHVGGRLFTS